MMMPYEQKATKSAHKLFTSSGFHNFILASGIAFVSLNTSATFAQSTSVAPRAQTVTVIKAQTREIVASTIVSGTLIAKDEILVAPEIDGLVITELLAEEGQMVAQGQVLARLNRKTLDVLLEQNAAVLARNNASIAQAEALINEASANQVQSANAFKRTQTLRQEGISSVEMFDQRLALAKSGEARFSQAREGLALAKAEKASTEAQRRDLMLRIERTEIKAPKAGMISRRTAKLGSAVGMAGEPLFRIIAGNVIELEARVSENDMPQLKLGQKVSVTPAGFEKDISGTVRLISPEVDSKTRLGRTLITLQEGQKLSVGAFAKGIIELNRKTGVAVPLSTITYSTAGTQVQVVKDGKVVLRPVTLGLIGNGYAEIAKGLANDEVIVARAGSFLREGDAVSPVIEKAEAPK